MILHRYQFQGYYSQPKPFFLIERGVTGYVVGMPNRQAHLTRSMSKKGCTPDNAACEGFFGRLKNEFFYDEDWLDVSIEHFIQLLDDYLEWYNHERIKLSLGGMSIMGFRKMMSFVA